MSGAASPRRGRATLSSLPAQSKIQIQAKVSLIIPKGTGCGNPPTGGGGTTMVMQFQFDVLSQVNVSHGTEFCEYDLFDDAPENFNFGGWITNVVIGVAVAVVCVLGAVFTGGLLGAALLGAAIGAAAATATIAIEDMNDCEVRSAKAAVGQIVCGAIAGAAIGYTEVYVMPFGVGTIWNTCYIWHSIWCYHACSNLWCDGTHRYNRRLRKDRTYFSLPWLSLTAFMRLLPRFAACLTKRFINSVYMQSSSLPCFQKGDRRRYL